LAEKLHLSRLPAAVLRDNAHDIVVKVEIADEIVVVWFTAGRNPESRVHG
jgi:hypothetical protein